MHSLVASRLITISALITLTTSLLTLAVIHQAPRATAQGSPACIALPSGLVSWWPGDGHSFDIQDGNHGTRLGGASYSAAKVGHGFTFDSDDDRVTIPHNTNLNINSPGFTAEFWIRGVKNQPQTLYTVIDKSHSFVDNTGWAFQGVSSTGSLAFLIGAGGGAPYNNFPLVASGDVLDGNFHHIAGTWDGANIRLYVDGVLQGVTPFTTPFNNTRVLNIGFAAGGGAPQRFFRGSVDEFGIYSRALSASEIQAIFNTGSSGKCKPFSVLVDPKAAYLYTNSDSPASPTIMNLAASGFAPGDVLKLSYAVAPPGFSFFSCSGPFVGAAQFALLGVFSSSNTLLATSASRRVPGAIDAGTNFVSTPTYYGNQPTDIPEDFWVTPPGGLTIQIPSGATHLFLGINDSLYYDNCGTIKVTIERVNQPPACQAQNVTVSASANCTASASIDNGSSDPDGDAITITQTPAGPYPLGATNVTLTVTDSKGASSSCAATVTVADSTPPQITPPPDASYQCLSQVPVGDPTQATATDSCSPPVTVTMADANNGGAGSPASPLFITRVFTAKDAVGNSASAYQTITVIDNTPPVIACPTSLTVAGNILGSCAANVSLGAATVTDNCGMATVAGVRSDGQALNMPYPQGATTITWTATDAAGNQSTCQQTVTVTNPAPLATITGPATGSVYAVGSPVNFTGSFSDNAGGAHTATWAFDSLTAAGAVNEATGAITGSFTFTVAGVYKVSLTVADGCGGTHTTDLVEPDGLTALIVIYDPSAGWVTGGGWINSPPGAYVADPSLTGKANFGFVSKYQNGASVPTGNTEFHFKAGNLKFQSTSYEWMVISGARAQYKGSGKINGAGDYRFMLTVIDGQEPGGGGQDKFRIRIWSDGGGLVYDNQMNAPDSDDPTTALGGGSIVIHR
jgi:hypothetical protein